MTSLTNPPHKAYYDHNAPRMELTERERQAVALLVEGLTVAKAAQTLGITKATFRKRLETAMNTYGALTRAELVSIFQERTR